MSTIIRNFDSLATTKLRHDALLIADAAYAAIDTERIIKNKMALEGTVLTVDGRPYDLTAFKRIKIIGFGKSSCRAIQTIESMLRERIAEGFAIDIKPGTCDIVQLEHGSHPMPSKENVALTQKIVGMAGYASPDDLFIVVVSGGGSSLLCWPLDECEQGIRLYEDFMRVGATIDEMNLVRRHISQVKGGGLAVMLHPATVIGLVFCDVPGDRFHDVASGPTYFDTSTRDDALQLLSKYGLSGYSLRETPKDQHFFEKVHNVPMLSNRTALESMQAKAEELGYPVTRVGDALYDEPFSLVQKMRDALQGFPAAIAGGEPRLAVRSPHAQGGRCQYVALASLKQMEHNQLFISIASDGLDNSDAAGALADMGTIERAARAGLNIDASLENFNAYPLLKTTDDLFYTGQTEANVSDLYMYLRAV